MPKLLKPEEIVNQNASRYINFDKQFIENQKLYTEVTCPVCDRKRGVLVYLIRAHRKTFTAICKYCARPAYKDARPLRLEEVRPEIREYVNLDRQFFKPVFNKKKQRFFNALFVDVTCKMCHSIRQVTPASIRAHDQHFTTLCNDCHNKGEHNPNWGGGRTVKYGSGYVALKVFDTHPDFEMVKSMIREDNTILEHRLVMAQKLGRALGRWELVHHVNGNKTDNEPENLIVTNHREHFAITLAESQVKKLRKKNESLKKRVRELEIQLREALDSR